MSTTATFTPRDDRGVELLDELEREAPAPFRLNLDTGARSYWIHADSAPPDGYEAALERLAPTGASTWRRPDKGWPRTASRGQHIGSLPLGGLQARVAEACPRQAIKVGVWRIGDER